jgi:hypothetical protein
MALTKLNNAAISSVTNTGLPALARTNMPTGTVIQVQSYSAYPGYGEVASSSGYVDSGINITITPTATSSKILLQCQWSWWLTTDANNYMQATIYRTIGGSGLTNLATDNTYDAMHFYGPKRHAGYNDAAYLQHIDSPNTTSACVYKIYVRPYDGTNNVRYKWSQTETTMHALEIAG